MNPLAKLAPLIRPEEKWSAHQLADFLLALPPQAMSELKLAFGLEATSEGERSSGRALKDSMAVQECLFRSSTNVLERPFKSVESLDYHEIVSWVAHRAGVSRGLVKSAPTFKLERSMFELLFIEQWSKLSQQQRIELLKNLDLGDRERSIAQIAALSGSSALAVLSATAAFSGFAFYTTMSATIAAVAGAAGVTLPFAAYIGASTLVGVLSGPVGWAIAGAAGLGGIALAGRADVKKTTAFIVQLHALKIAVMQAAGISDNVLKKL